VITPISAVAVKKGKFRANITIISTNYIKPEEGQWRVLDFVKGG